jgi:hypothetical protein
MAKAFGLFCHKAKISFRDFCEGILSRLTMMGTSGGMNGSGPSSRSKFMALGQLFFHQQIQCIFGV